MHNGLYWIHKFHHQYSNIVIPSSAFSVSVYEFIYAYFFPFLISAFFIYPSDLSYLSSVAFITSYNLFIHTPALKYVELPKFLVSPMDHLMHHEMQSKNFAAPVFSLDRLFYFFR
jgi:sterol desaturase/sphingolipid hydroxylase (fatty acid hydroxylase superfamily)